MTFFLVIIDSLYVLEIYFLFPFSVYIRVICGMDTLLFIVVLSCEHIMFSLIITLSHLVFSSLTRYIYILIILTDMYYRTKGVILYVAALPNAPEIWPLRERKANYGICGVYVLCRLRMCVCLELEDCYVWTAVIVACYRVYFGDGLCIAVMMSDCLFIFLSKQT